MTIRILQGDCVDLLRTLADASVHCCVTSPPYFGLRDYDIQPTRWPAVEFKLHEFMPSVQVEAMECCLGLEASPLAFIGHCVLLFREVRRVLRDDGTLWLNIGDSYVGSPPGNARPDHSGNRKTGTRGEQGNAAAAMVRARGRKYGALKQKDMLGIPWMLAFALRADGWYLRQDIIWSKPNPMPESVRDRCTKAHEYLFLLSKSPRYYFDAEAIKEATDWDASNTKMPDGWDTGEGGHGSFHRNCRERGRKTELARGFRGGAYVNNSTHDNSDGGARTAVGNDYAPEGFMRNKRSVWTVATQPFKEAHFATFPPALIEPCIKAGCPQGGVVLDPFGGAGTTGLVTDRLQRDAVLIELSQKYTAISHNRIQREAPLLADVTVAI